MYSALKKFGAAKSAWRYTTSTAFLETIVNEESYTQGFSLCDSEELSVVVTDNLDEYRAWCSEHRTLCTLKSIRPNDLALASYLDVDLGWKVKPESNHKGYLRGYKNLVFDRKYLKTACKESAFSFQTQDPNSTVYLKKGCMSEELLDLPGTIQAWMDIHEKDFSAPSFSSLVIPMIDYEKPVDLSPMLGASFTDTDGDCKYLNEVQAMVSLILDPNGVKAKAEFHAGASKSAPRNIVIDEPFTLWIMRKGLDFPVVAAYLSYDSWQESH
jgi:hypothetical protein